MVKIGIIGGSGFGDIPGVENIKKIKKHTPYGSPSDMVALARLKGVDVVILPRHGDNHTIQPSLVNYRANIWMMKELGVTHIIAPTACGSLNEGYGPETLVFVDQFIDRTAKRHCSFYEGHEVCHIPMAEPFCQKLRALLSESASFLGLKAKDKGTIVTIEGPRFSTKAESRLFRSWGCDAVNMTTVPEVVLSREAGICYASIAMVTDYDSFMDGRPPVTIEEVLKIMKINKENVNKLIMDVIPRIFDWNCGCMESIKSALI